MKRQIALLTLFASGCLAAGSEQIPALIERISKLADREPVESAIDTRLRAGHLLMSIEPDVAKKFLSSGMELLRAHPELPRGRNITEFLFALDVPDVEKVVLGGSDRVNSYNQLSWYWAIKGQESRAAALLRRALKDTGVPKDLEKLWGVERVLIPLSLSDPQDAAALFIDVARVGHSQKVGHDLVSLLAQVVQNGFLHAPPAKAGEVAEAMRMLVSFVRDPNFPGENARVTPVRREFPGQKVETRNNREAFLVRFGSLLHVIAPNVFEESRDLFEPWEVALRSVDVPRKIASLWPMPPARPANSAPRVDLLKAPLAEALAAAEKMDEKPRIEAYEAIVMRSDITPEQRSGAAESARNLIRSRLTAVLAKGSTSPWDYVFVAKIMRVSGVQLESDNPALKAKQALLDLEEAVQVHYDFTLPDQEGKIHKLSDERGKVVLLNFWATWCPPCRAEMPMLAKLQREWGPRGLSIIAITDEAPQPVAAYEGQFNYNLRMLLDPARNVFGYYRIQGIPDTRIIDRSGHVIASFGELISEEEVVRALLAAGLTRSEQ